MGHQRQFQRDRLYLYDLLRLLAIVEMVFGHTVTALVAPEYRMGLGWQAWEVFRGLTAPLFLIVSGVVQVYANKRDNTGRVLFSIVWRRIWWAVALIGIGYLLVFPARSLQHLPYVPEQAWQAFWKVNILQLIGATLIVNTLLFALTRTVAHYRRWAGLLGWSIAAVTPWVQQVPVQQWLPLPLAQYFTFAGGSLFPVFPYAAYMFLGGWLGARLYQMPQEAHRRYYQRRLLPLALAGMGFAAIGLWGVKAPFVPLFGAQQSSWALFGFRLTGVLLLIAVFGGSLPQYHRWYPALTLVSSRAFFLYILHLVLLYGTAWWNGPARIMPSALSVVEGVGAALLLIGVCVAAAVAVAQLRQKYQQLYVWLRSSIVVVIAALLILP